MPLVSIIVPAYNCERYLRQAVDSIRAQTVQDFEILIVDDGSTDRTPDIARELAATDARVRIFTQSNSGGPAGPRNRAIGLSTGELLAFLDPDDFWHPTKLARQIAVL